MRRTIAVFLFSCLCTVFFCPPAAAKNHVPEIEIDVTLCQDGSAAITQVWTADTDEGTEFYLVCRDSGYLSITDFSVSDESGAYTLLENWDIDAPFEEKAGKCGIHRTQDGVELCWGISEYGHRRYTVTYVLHDLVGAYSDADGFNHRFVDEMSVFPTDVALTIRSQDGTPLTDDICDIWAFGYDGEIWFEDGAIRAQSETSLKSGQHMTVMVSLEKGLLSPLRIRNESFERLKERAFEGSDYGKKEGSSYGKEETTFVDFLLILLQIGVVCLLISLSSFISEKLRKAKLRKRMKRADYFRDAPNDGNLNVTYRLSICCGLCREDSLLGAYLLRLISDGSLEPEETDDRSPQVDLRLTRPPQSGSSYEENFYTILEAAAGTDGVLQAKELEQFCERSSEPLTAFLESCRKDSEQVLVRTGCYCGANREGMRSLTRQGLQQLDEILGLKKFLLDFSLIRERGVTEAVIWQDYLIYAHLLGIADRVTPQIRELYPNALPQIERFERCMDYARDYDRMMHSAYEREQRVRNASRSSGSGGRSSSGGGGGHSGGGGGGTR